MSTTAGKTITPQQVRTALVKAGAKVASYVPSAPDPRLVSANEIGEVGAGMPTNARGQAGGIDIQLFDSQSHAESGAAYIRDRLGLPEGNAGLPKMRVIQRGNLVAVLSSATSPHQLQTYRTLIRNL